MLIARAGRIGGLLFPVVAVGLLLDAWLVHMNRASAPWQSAAVELPATMLWVIAELQVHRAR